MTQTEPVTGPRPEQAAERLHRRLAGLLAEAKRHHSPALQQLAALRGARGGAYGTSADASAALLRLVGTEMPDGHQRQDDLMLVAWLVAQYRPAVARATKDGEPLPASWRGFGGEFARAARRAGGAPGPGAERLMKRLLDARREDLHRQLQRAFAQFRGTDVSVDVAQLVADLRDWDREDRRVQRRWAHQFWVASSVPNNEDESEDDR